MAMQIRLDREGNKNLVPIVHPQQMYDYEVKECACVITKNNDEFLASVLYGYAKVLAGHQSSAIQCWIERAQGFQIRPIILRNSPACITRLDFVWAAMLRARRGWRTDHGGCKNTDDKEQNDADDKEEWEQCLHRTTSSILKTV